MTSPTSSFRRAVAITIACAVLGLSATACSVVPTTSHGGAGAGSASSAHTSASAADSGDDSGSATGDDGSSGTNTGLCADATGEGFTFDGDDSDVSKALQTWDKMADDAPGDIHEDVAAVDQVLHKISTGDAGAADQAFADHLTKVATWVADNCKL
jgi:hypothetical protein